VTNDVEGASYRNGTLEGLMEINSLAIAQRRPATKKTHDGLNQHSADGSKE
jgi:hypothetical protein